MAGGNAGSLAILKAAEQIADRLREEGRPLTEVTRRDVVADHESNTVDLTIAVEAGARSTAGCGDRKGRAIRRFQFHRLLFAPQAGPDLFTGTTAQGRRENSGPWRILLVTVNEAEALEADGSLPIASWSPRASTAISGSAPATHPSTVGGIEGYWGHRNLFGQAESLRIEGSVRGWAN